MCVVPLSQLHTGVELRVALFSIQTRTPVPVLIDVHDVLGRRRRTRNDEVSLAGLLLLLFCLGVPHNTTVSLGM